MSPGDLVLIRFPQADLRAGKLRPALVVAIAPGRHPDVLLALVTSRVYQAVPGFDEVVDPSAADYAATGLKVRSVIRLARLVTVDPAAIEARLGTISPGRLDR
ncbi:MAG: type II toxin-antitoxin system PemK/MazF family toxin, partial [Anaerolineales bacterium]